MTSASDAVLIYTDGSCLKNPNGPGGWSVVIAFPDGSRSEAYGCSPSTTNNRMEMLAAIQALCIISSGSMPRPAGGFILHSDSEYVLKGATERLQGWKRHGWLTSAGTPVKNQDLWQDLDAALQGLPLQWKWVRGHAGIPLNERADKLAGLAARTQTSGFESYTAEDIAQEAFAEPKSKRAGPIELDLNLSDEQLANQVRNAIMAANGKIVRFRESEAPLDALEYVPPSPRQSTGASFRPG